MAHLCFIPHPLTGEETPQGGLPEWAICHDEATLFVTLPEASLPSPFFVVRISFLLPGSTGHPFLRSWDAEMP